MNARFEQHRAYQSMQKIQPLNWCIPTGIYNDDDPALNMPGARMDCAHWVDSNNKVWIFGGLGVDGYDFSRLRPIVKNVTLLSVGRLNDLWSFVYCEECLNGICIGINHCNCSPGWTGDNCGTGNQLHETKNCEIIGLASWIGLLENAFVHQDIITKFTKFTWNFLPHIHWNEYVTKFLNYITEPATSLVWH